jgi:hypothetical protein
VFEVVLLVVFDVEFWVVLDVEFVVVLLEEEPPINALQLVVIPL